MSEFTIAINKLLDLHAQKSTNSDYDRGVAINAIAIGRGKVLEVLKVDCEDPF